MHSKIPWWSFQETICFKNRLQSSKWIFTKDIKNLVLEQMCKMASHFIYFLFQYRIYWRWLKVASFFLTVQFLQGKWHNNFLKDSKTKIQNDYAKPPQSPQTKAKQAICQDNKIHSSWKHTPVPRFPFKICAQTFAQALRPLHPSSYSEPPPSP